MDLRIASLGDLSALDVAGRVIKISFDGGGTWTFALLRGQGDFAAEMLGGIIVDCAAGSSPRSIIINKHDFQRPGLIIMQATVDEVQGLSW